MHDTKSGSIMTKDTAHDNDETPSSSSSSSQQPSLMDSIPNEVLLVLLYYVPSKDLLKSVSLVSKQLTSVSKSHLHWQSRCNALVESPTPMPKLNVHQMQRCSVFIEAHKNENFSSSREKKKSKKEGGGGEEEEIPNLLTPISLLVPQESARPLYNSKRKRICLATTIDNPEENLENVLPPLSEGGGQGRIGGWMMWSQAGTYWSSASAPVGTPGQSDEVLLFTTSCPHALISNVAIKPFTEIQYRRRQTYTWYGTVIRVYRLKEEEEGIKEMIGFPCGINEDSDRDKASSSSLVEGRYTAPTTRADRIQTFLSECCTLVYQSQTHETTDRLDDNIKEYVLPPGIIGNVVTFTLIGKHFRQFETSGFYACVEKVEVNGIPLLTHAAQLEEEMDNDAEPWLKGLIGSSA